MNICVQNIHAALVPRSFAGRIATEVLVGADCIVSVGCTESFFGPGVGQGIAVKSVDVIAIDNGRCVEGRRANEQPRIQLPGCLVELDQFVEEPIFGRLLSARKISISHRPRRAENGLRCLR